jgi:lipopolysaccharide biosynthesis protein
MSKYAWARLMSYNIGRYVPANGDFSKMTEKSIDMLPRTGAKKMAHKHQFHQLKPCGVRSVDVTYKRRLIDLICFLNYN